LKFGTDKQHIAKGKFPHQILINVQGVINDYVHEEIKYSVMPYRVSRLWEWLEIWCED